MNATSPINTRTNSSSSTSSTAFTHTSPSNNAASQVPVPMGNAAAAAGQPSASTDSYLKDFTLLAEAAKRAQVAVMVRDFEDCSL